MLEGLFALILLGLMLFLLGFMLWFGVWLVILLPAGMAEDRNRSALLWVLVSLFGSPVLAILLLMALGARPPGGPGA